VSGSPAARRSESSTDRHLAAVFGFYDFHARSGVTLADSLARRRVPRGSYKPFLHDVSAGRCSSISAQIQAHEQGHRPSASTCR
jgi:hypothetical protein